jgi:hypothetical protein
MSKVKTFLKSYKDRLPGGTADNKSPKDFDKEQLSADIKVKKSYDYQDQFVSIDAKDQQAAEEGTPSSLLDYMRNCMYKGPDSKENIDAERHQGIYKIPFLKGTLTLAQKADNLYNCDFSDIQGQVVEKLSDVTLEIAAKTLMVKGFIQKADYEPILASTPAPVAPAPVIIEAPSDGPKSVRIKMGDFEFEMRKSIKDFVSDFRNARQHPQDLMKKAIKSWRRNNQFQQFTNDTEAAKFILSNWEQEKERFNQILFAVQQNQK